MSRRQRAKRRQRQQGAKGAKIVGLGIGVVLAVAAIGACAGIGYIISIAQSVPDIDTLKPVDKGAVSEIFASDGSRLGFIESDELRTPIEGRDHPQARQAGDRRDRGPPLLRARRRRLPGHRSRRDRQRPQRQDRAGRLDDHHAARPQPRLRLDRAHLPAQDQGGQARRGARERALEGVDPRRVPQQRPVRHRRRALGDRHRGGVARCSSTSPRKKLKLKEAALLAGLPQAPSEFNPFTNPAGRQGAPQRGAAQHGLARR